MHPDPDTGQIRTFRDTDGTSSTSIVLDSGDRKPVEVRMGDTWYPGELRAWRRDGDRWTANVAWSEEPGVTRLDNVDQDDVREAPE